MTGLASLNTELDKNKRINKHKWMLQTQVKVNSSPYMYWITGNIKCYNVDCGKCDNPNSTINGIPDWNFIEYPGEVE